MMLGHKVHLRLCGLSLDDEKEIYETTTALHSLKRNINITALLN